MGWRIPTKGPRRISVRRNAISKQKSAPPCHHHESTAPSTLTPRGSAPSPPVFPAQLLLTASGGFHSTSAADFLNWPNSSGRSGRASRKPSSTEDRAARRCGSLKQPTMCNCGRLSANCPHGFPAGGEQPRCRPHIEPGNPRAGLRDWLCNMDPRRSKCAVSFRHRFVPEGYHRSNRAPERTGSSLDLLTCSRWSPHSDWYVTSLIQPRNRFATQTLDGYVLRSSSATLPSTV